jgi:hypothetical protein
MFGGNDQPPPAPPAPIQKVESSAGTPPVSPTAGSAAAKAAGAGQLPTTQTPGVLTETDTTTKKSTGSLIGGQ